MPDISIMNKSVQKKVYILLLLLFFTNSGYAVVHRALIFGLGKQKDELWTKINGDNDIFYVTQMLQTMNYSDVKTLKNEQATKQAMVKAFIDLANRCESGDIIYIHYSGHGQLMTDLNGDEATRWNTNHAQWDEAWIPYDAYMYYGEEDNGEKHLSDDEIAELLMSIRYKIGNKGQITVVIDACHSGDSTRGYDDEPVRGIGVKFNIPKSDKQGRCLLIEEQWRTISACKPYQCCTEIKDLNIGKLTYALYSLGPQAFDLSNEQLETILNEFMEFYKGGLPQQPMVRGEK